MYVDKGFVAFIYKTDYIRLFSFNYEESLSS